MRSSRTVLARRMKTFLLTILTLGTIAAAAFAGGLAETCFHKGDKVDGGNKICYYDCPSGEAAITVKSYQLCPLRISR
jgi:hypothetical protein